MKSGSQLVEDIIKLSEIDTAVAKIKGDSESAKKRLQTAKEKHAASLAQKANLEKMLKDLERKYEREATDLKFEQEKLVKRRKALSTLPSVKAQQAGLREIDSVQRQLELREEHMIVLMDEIDSVKKELETLGEVESGESELKSLEDETNNILANNEERIGELKKKREEIVGKLDSDVLKRYNSIARKYPMNPVVAVDGDNCSGCYMNLVPQIKVKIARGKELVQCPGCSRILHL